VQEKQFISEVTGKQHPVTFKLWTFSSDQWCDTWQYYWDESI